MMEYEIIKTTEEAVEILQSYDFNTPTFLDIETEGLYGYIRLIQVYQPQASDLVYILDMDYCNLDMVKTHLKPLWSIGHNLSYDFGTLNMTTARFDDTQWLSRLAYPQWQKFGLADVTDRLVSKELYDGLDKSKLQKAGFVRGAYLSQAQLKYSATDVYALDFIWNDPKIQYARKTLAYEVDIKSLEYSIVYQQNGLLVDQAAVAKEIIQAEALYDEQHTQLNGLNPNSPKQVKAAFKELTGVEPESTDKSFLIRQIAEGGTKGVLAEAVFKQRRTRLRLTNLNKYNKPKVYTRFNPAGAATGRFASTGGDGLPNSINAQNITRDLQYIFNADTEDTVVVHADYSTAELRAGCSIMQDGGMYKDLMNGIDLHKIAATLAMGGKPEDVDKEARQRGKAISFGFIFGMSAPSFVDYAYDNYGVVFTLKEAKAVKAAYQRRYPGIARYAQARWNDYKTNFVVTPQGHVNKPRLGTDAINHATQGCIAETIKLALGFLVVDSKGVALEYIYNIVHDSMYLRVPRGQEEMWADRVVDAMRKGWQEMCKLDMLYYKDIPMPIEVEYLDIVREEV